MHVRRVWSTTIDGVNGEVSYTIAESMRTNTVFDDLNCKNLDWSNSIITHIIIYRLDTLYHVSIVSSQTTSVSPGLTC